MPVGKMEEEIKAFTAIIKLLEPFEKDTQTRIIAIVRLLLDVPNVKHVVTENP